MVWWVTSGRCLTIRNGINFINSLTGKHWRMIVKRVQRVENLYLVHNLRAIVQKRFTLCPCNGTKYFCYLGKNKIRVGAELGQAQVSYTLDL